MKKSVGYQVIFCRLIITVLIVVIVILTCIELYEVADGTRNWVGKFSLTWGLALIGLIGSGLLVSGWGLLNLWAPKRFTYINQRFTNFRGVIGWFGWVLAGLLAVIPAKIFMYTPLGFKLTGVGFRLSIFITIVLVMSVLLTKEKGKLINLKGVFVSIVFLGSVFAFARGFVNVVDHPLSLTWSEGNRIWDYSVLFGRDLYKYPETQPIKAYIDRGRQTLWGLPFLLPNISIVLVRMWSAILFTIPYALLGWMAFHPFRHLRYQWIWLGLWSFLFLNQGPVYTPLILSAILVVGSRRKPFWIALPLIYLAGRYVQISRITWLFAPALWAGLIALLDITDAHKNKLTFKNWGKILVYGLIGLLGGFGIRTGWLEIQNYFLKASRNKVDVTIQQFPQSIYTDVSDVTEVLGAAANNNGVIDQPFLWERLLPNPTYGLGVILGLLLAVGPIILILIYLVRSKRWNLNRLQFLGLLGVLGSLMVVGIVISTKIGGGGDLHNLDMFLVSLVLAAGLAWEYGGHEFFSKPKSVPLHIKLILLLTAGIPAFMPWVDAKPLELPPEDKTQWTLELLQSETTRVLEEGGEILFMDQRQLLTFGYLGEIPLVPEYEKKLVMDRAMSGNLEYFEPFYNDIANHRFGLIITDPQRIRYSEGDEGWGAENDVWVEWVTKPLLCDYEPVYTIKTTGVWFLIPRELSGDCSSP